MKFSIDERIQEIPSYPKARAYGYEEGLIRLSANENPYPPSPKVVSAIMDSLPFLNRYPDGELELKEAIGEHLSLKPENVIVGCGSNEIIEIVLRVAKKENRNKVIIPNPTFAFYSIAAKIYGYEVVHVPLKGFNIDLEKIKDTIDEKTRIIFLANPNNPTGTIIKKRDFESFLREIPPEVLLVVDEAYYEFVESKSFPVSFQYIGSLPIVTLRTFSKAYGLAGLRIGFGISDANLIRFLERAKQPFSTNMVALIAAKAALKDRSYTEKIVGYILEQKRFLYESLRKMGLEFVPSESNFILIKLGDKAEAIMEKLFEQRIVVRWMGPMGFPQYIRVTIGKRQENEAFLEALGRIITPK